MSQIRWKCKRIIGLFTGIILFYLIFRTKKHEFKAFAFLPNTKPNHVWEFVADFSNMKLLNPTIVDFSVIDEQGNYDHWRYTVYYSERLSHWPYFYNHAEARFSVKISPKKDIYYIFSVHRTCLLRGLLCSDSKSEFRFSHNQSANGALCEEFIEYECPAGFSSFCKREVVFQRTAIMNNLKRHFQHEK